ncbi:MAG: hypothetical protein WEB13_10030 [Dehalococcoidia bacterium]
MRVRLIRWHESDAEELIAAIRDGGHDTDAAVPVGPVDLRALRAAPPDVVVVDLARRPATGRDLAIAIRRQAATRHVPLVFVDGSDDAVERIAGLLPDAICCTRAGIGAALAAASAPRDPAPVVPRSRFAAYEGRPLAGRLGIRAGMAVAILGEPDGFRATLGALPAGVTLRQDARGRPDLVLWFVTTLVAVERRIEHLGATAGAGGLWVLWPKRASARGGELTQPIVRRAGLDRGLVDYRVVRVDETWTGLRFTRRAS